MIPVCCNAFCCLAIAAYAALLLSSDCCCDLRRNSFNSLHRGTGQFVAVHPLAWI